MNLLPDPIDTHLSHTSALWGKPLTSANHHRFDNKADLRDNVSRSKASSPLGTSSFVGLCAADAVLQYSILRQGWGRDLAILLPGAAILSTTAAGGILGLNPDYAAISALALRSSFKQTVHLLLVSGQEMPPASALGISLFNTIFNSANTLLSLWATFSIAPTTIAELSSSPTFLFGVGMYVVGMLTEAISEFQRKAFKADPANKGKPYGGGLFSLATNITMGATRFRAPAMQLLPLACTGVLLSEAGLLRLRYQGVTGVGSILHGEG